jgi:Dolichyl-phosphate-mannose-protein mannosyltransferase
MSDLSGLDEGRPSRGRRVELGAFVLAVLAGAFRVVAVSGGPTTPFWALLGGCALCLLVSTALGGTRWLDGWRLPIVLLLLWQMTQVYPLIRGDGYEYFALSRSTLFDRDLDLSNDYAGLHTRGLLAPTGEVALRGPCGMAILWMPFILVAHGLTLLARVVLGADVAADGFSAPYQATATLATFGFGIMSLLLTESLVRRFFDPVVAGLVAFALWVGTPLCFYAVANPFMSHAGSALAVTAFLLVWLRARQAQGMGPWLVAGLVGGLMALVRIQDAVFLAVPLGDLLLDRHRHWLRRAGLFLAGPLLAALLQALVWARYWGASFLTDVTTQNLVGSELHLESLLFSARHGLFTWTPLLLLATVGLLLGLRRSRRLFGLALLGLSLSILVNSSLSDWWGSDSFGQRRLLGLTPLFGLGLGEAVTLLSSRLLPTALIIVGLSFWNQQLAVVYNAKLVAGMGQPLTLDRLLPAQVDLFYRWWCRDEARLPHWMFVIGYDNLKGIWLDEGRSLSGRVDLGTEAKDLPFLVGSGWLAPEEEGGVRFRRSSGPSSSLRVPIYTPGSFRLRAKVRSLNPERLMSVHLGVNGVDAGEAVAPPEWADIEFEIPRSATRSGLNTITLRYELKDESLHPSVARLEVQELLFERIAPLVQGSR